MFSLRDATGIDHGIFSAGLKKSLFNFMHGIGFDMSLQEWFDFEIPPTTIAPFYIEDCLNKESFKAIKSNSKVIWLGTFPLIGTFQKTKKGKQVTYLDLVFHDKSGSFHTRITRRSGQLAAGSIRAVATGSKTHHICSN